MSIGRLFQMDEAGCLKHANQFSFGQENIKRLRVSADERSARRGASVLIIDVRCDGSPDCRTLYVSVVTLKFMWYLTKRQCRPLNIFVMLIRPSCCVMTRARVIWIRWSRPIFLPTCQIVWSWRSRGCNQTTSTRWSWRRRL